MLSKYFTNFGRILIILKVGHQLNSQDTKYLNCDDQEDPGTRYFLTFR